MSRPEITGRKLRQGAKAEVKAPLIRGPPIAAYSLKEFAEAHRISLDFLFRLLREGLGPKVMKVGARTLISVEAAADWRRAREVTAAE